MQFKALLSNLLLLSVALCGCRFHQHKTEKTTNKTVRYELVENWPQLPPDFVMGNPTGVGIDTNQNIFVFHRAYRVWGAEMATDSITAATILLLDPNTGNIIASWGANLFIMPHGLTVDHQNNVWVTDVGLHQVFKFSHNGNLLMTLGEAGKPGKDSTHFNLPTDVAVSPDGSFYVSDGYGNSRIVKFSATGKYLFEWGSKGNLPGQFDTPHGIDLGNEGNVYVADRENSRVQCFTANGEFIKEWSNHNAGSVYSVVLDKTGQTLISTDYLKINGIIIGSDVIITDLHKDAIHRFGKSGQYDGPVCRYHDVAIDKQHNIYVGDILGNRVQKFKPVAD